MENKLSLEKIIELSELLPIPLKYFFLKSLKLAIKRAKEGEENV